MTGRESGTETTQWSAQLTRGEALLLLPRRVAPEAGGSGVEGAALARLIADWRWVAAKAAARRMSLKRRSGLTAA
jgi:hypothetical protein